jgi:hypothetical protein
MIGCADARDGSQGRHDDARWSEIDLAAKTWTVPGERMKLNEQHLSRSLIEPSPSSKRIRGDGELVELGARRTGSAPPGGGCMTEAEISWRPQISCSQARGLICFEKRSRPAARRLNSFSKFTGRDADARPIRFNY